MTLSPYEQMKSDGVIKPAGRPRLQLSDVERRKRLATQKLLAATARNHALAVIAVNHADEYSALQATERAWLLANDDRFESLRDNS